MPSPRQKVTGVPLPGLQPRQSQTDVFAGPGSAGADLARLADALSGIAPNLLRLGLQRKQEDNQEQLQAGAQYIREANKSYAELVESGELEQYNNPFFQLGAKEQAGRAAAERASSDFRFEMNKGLQEDTLTSMDDFDELRDEFLDRFVDESLGEGSDDLDLASAFRIQFDAQANGMRQQVASELGRKAIDKNFDDLYATVFEGVRNQIESGSTMSEITAALHLEQQRQIAVVKPSQRKEVNNTIMEAAADAAIGIVRRGGDMDQAMSILEAVGRVPGGTGEIGSTKEGQDILDQTYRRLAQLDGEVDSAAERATEEAAAALYLGAVEEVMTNGAGADLTPFVEALSSIPDANQAVLAATLSRVASLKDQLVAGDVARFTDPNLLDSLSVEIWNNQENGPAMRQRLISLVQSKQLGWQDFIMLNNQISTQTSAEESVNTNTPEFTRTFSLLRSSFGSEFSITEEAIRRRDLATASFQYQWTEWRLANPEANASEQLRFMQPLQNELYKQYAEEIPEFLGDFDPRIRLSGQNGRPGSWWASPERMPERVYQNLRAFMFPIAGTGQVRGQFPLSNETLEIIWDLGLVTPAGDVDFSLLEEFVRLQGQTRASSRGPALRQ